MFSNIKVRLWKVSWLHQPLLEKTHLIFLWRKCLRFLWVVSSSSQLQLKSVSDNLWQRFINEKLKFVPRAVQVKTLALPQLWQHLWANLPWTSFIYVFSAFSTWYENTILLTLDSLQMQKKSTVPSPEIPFTTADSFLNFFSFFSIHIVVEFKGQKEAVNTLIVCVYVFISPYPRT